MFSLCTEGIHFQPCVRSVVPYGSEWEVKEEDLAKLERNDMMVQMCNVTLRDRKSQLGERPMELVSIRNCIQ